MLLLFLLAILFVSFLSFFFCPNCFTAWQDPNLECDGDCVVQPFLFFSFVLSFARCHPQVEFISVISHYDIALTASTAYVCACVCIHEYASVRVCVQTTYVYVNVQYSHRYTDIGVFFVFFFFSALICCPLSLVSNLLNYFLCSAMYLVFLVFVQSFGVCHSFDKSRENRM